MSDLKSHIIHGEPSQNKGLPDAWPTKHDGQSDRMSDKSDMRFSTGTSDRSLAVPTCQRQEGCQAFRGQKKFVNVYDD